MVVCKQLCRLFLAIIYAFVSNNRFELRKKVFSGDRLIEETASGFSDPHDLPTTSHPLNICCGGGRIRTYCVSNVLDLQSSAHPPSEQHPHIICDYGWTRTNVEFYLISFADCYLRHSEHIVIICCQNCCDHKSTAKIQQFFDI